jgi:hypothetical protein
MLVYHRQACGLAGGTRAEYVGLGLEERDVKDRYPLPDFFQIKAVNSERKTVNESIGDTRGSDSRGKN